MITLCIEWTGVFFNMSIDGIIRVACLPSGAFFAFLCVLGWGALDRLWLRAAQFVRVCSTTGYITSGLRGPSSQA